MEADHTPNEFPFSCSGGTELLQVPLSYTTSSEGRQIVFTTMSPSPAGGAATPLPLMADPAGLLDALKHDSFVTVDAFDGAFAAHPDSVAAVSARPAAVYQTGHEMPSSAELVHAVTELQLQQYVQHQPAADHQHQHQHQQDIQHQQQQQQQQDQPGHPEQQGLQQNLPQPQPQEQLRPEASEPASLVEITHRTPGTPCFLCDTPAAGGRVEIFGESNILSASKTPVCVKLECVLGCPLAAEQVHSDALCLACLQLLETADGVDCRLKELESQSRELSGRLRRRFGRTVRDRKLHYSGWHPPEEPTDDLPEETAAGTAPNTVAASTSAGAGDTAPGDPGAGSGGARDGSGDARDGGGGGGSGGGADGSWTAGLASPAGSPGPAAGDLSDPDDPVITADPVKAQAVAAARKKRTGTRARSKVVVADPRDPARTKTKYIYDQSYSCSVCGKTFAWKGHLAKHFQTHTGERPLHCHVCGQTFRWSSHLTSHLRRHNNDRPFVCSVCGKGFVSGSVFKGHMRTHTDEKPFMCGVCGKQFRDKSNLRTHEWVHSDQRPHRCQPCDRGFLTTSALKVHNRTVHGAAPAPAPAPAPAAAAAGRVGT